MVRVSLGWLAAAVACVSAVGCTSLDREFVCSNDASCAGAGPSPRCEADHHCSLASDGCPGGRRYGGNAGDRAGACVGAIADDLAMPPPPDLGPSADLTSLPCPADVLFCDDFEHGPIWDDTQTSASLRIDSAAAHTGSHALHVTGSSGSVSTYWRKNLSKTITSGGTLSMRAWILVRGKVGASLQPFGICDGKNQSDSTFFNAMLIHDDLWSMSTHLNEHDSGNNPIAEGVWTCVTVDANVVAQSSTGSIELHVNGTKLLDFQEPTNPLGRGLKQAVVGLVDSMNSAGVDVYIDDIAVADYELSCN